MRKLFVKMSMSLDGFVATKSGRKDWVFQSSDVESRNWAVGLSNEAGLIIMGRKSFHQMAPYWPGADGPFAAPMNRIAKAVFSKKGYEPASALTAEILKLPAADSWANAKVCSGDLTTEIRALKEQPGKPIMAIGGAGFVSELLASGEVDGLQLAIHPVLLGDGLQVFNGLIHQQDLQLKEVRSFGGGIVALSYDLVK